MAKGHFKPAEDMQAGLAASQTAFASYRQLQNETQLYAINMQFSGGQVQTLRAQPVTCQCPGPDTLLFSSQLVQVSGKFESQDTLVVSGMTDN